MTFGGTLLAGIRRSLVCAHVRGLTIYPSDVPTATAALPFRPGDSVAHPHGRHPMTGFPITTVLAVVALVAMARSWPPDDPGDGS